MNQRVQRLRQRLADEGNDAVFISAPENRRYLSGFTGSAGYLIVSQEHAYVATDFRYWEQVGRQSPDFELVKMTQGDLGTWLAPVLERIQPATLAFEAGNATFAFHTTLKESLKKLRPALRPRLVPTLDLVEGLRIVKDEEELQIITRAVEIADQAYMEVSAGLEPGITEREIAWRLEKSMREQGAESTSFDIIVAAGPNAAMPHHRPTDRPVEKDEPIIIDMGARLQGYCSDLSRTTFLGKPDDTYRRVYDVVLGAQETAIAAVQSGMTGHDADRLARDVIEKAGYGEQFGHGTGHGVGLVIHENPRVARNAKNELSDGMVFTVEPGVYLPGWGGVRIEDIVVLENGSSRNLTRAPKTDALAV
ncbi:MAG: aminopeptidase P family protein [Chloroflexi bacterium]|nr:aminopeptidase P family protein [Chloroflexota bacterium]